MKKIITLIMASLLVYPAFLSTVSADDTDGFSYIAQLSKLIETYDSDNNYFGTIHVKIGESELTIDGEQKPVDESGSSAYIENGRTMMPVRGLAEAIGADVSFDNKRQIVTVENQEKTIALTIGEPLIQINGIEREIRTAPELKNDHTMLPVRDVAEALDCEVEWNNDTQTAIFTKPFQTKRIIAYAENVDTTDAVSVVKGDGFVIMQYATIEAAKSAIEQNKNQGIEAEPDQVCICDSLSWGVKDIGPDKYYEQVDYASGSAVVAVIDSGIDFSHPYFKGRLVDGYDLVHNDRYPEDENGHGTHVASTVLDMAGYNQNIKVMPVKALDAKGTGYISTIASAIDYATTQGVDVISMSLGGGGNGWLEETAIQKALRKNIAVIAAAGNESLNLESRNYIPATINGVITVSALDKNGSLAAFSNYGKGVVKFAAPGVNIQGALRGGGYGGLSGTSMATPHVAGVYALAKAVHPDMDIDEITKGLQENAIYRGSSRYFGSGEIRAYNLESHLSSVSSSAVSVSDVTETNAVISGKISYKGIAPEYVGIRLYSSSDEWKDIYTTRYVNDGNKTMNFICNLNRNANYTLKSGTQYKISIFMQPAGMDYVAKSVEFTTKGQSTSDPEPTKSNLKINPTVYPQGTIQQGKVFALKGKITSNYHITDVRSYLLDENNNIVQQGNGSTTTATYVIDGSRLDGDLHFEKLSPGGYYLQYAATDESGNSVGWKSELFYVSETDTPPKSALQISPSAYPRGEIKKGKTFSLKGKITSDCHITAVRSFLLDENDNVVQQGSGWTTTATYVINNSRLDLDLHFEKLATGSYYLRYEAEDESGNSVSWTSNVFYIVN